MAKKSMSPEQLGHLMQLIRDGIDLASKACNGYLDSGHHTISKESDQGEPVEILPYLYLGSGYHASNKRMLDKLGITALLNVSQSCPNHFENSFVYKCIPVEDSSSEEISIWFDEAIDFIGKSEKPENLNNYLKEDEEKLRGNKLETRHVVALVKMMLK